MAEVKMPTPEQAKEVAKSAVKDIAEGAVDGLAEVTLGTAVGTKKKSELSKISRMVISEDAGTVGTYLLTNHVVPFFKDLILAGVEYILYGKSSARGNKKGTGVVNGGSYNSIYDGKSSSVNSQQSGSRMELDDIVFEDRMSAQEKKDLMEKRIGQYGKCSVAYLKGVCGVTSEWTDNTFGWTSTDGCYIRSVGGGKWALCLPDAVVINK